MSDTPTKATKKSGRAAAPPAASDAAYLLAAGWRPESDPAQGPTRWCDPQAPAADVYTEAAVGSKKLPSGKLVTVYQTAVTPAAWPLPEAEAVRVQRERDAAQGV